MTAYNIVRMRVKAGHEEQFLALHRDMDKSMQPAMRANGFRKGAIVKTGERSYCFLGEWESMEGIAKSRAEMVANLDRMRPMLEDLGNGLGVTDPVSGDAVLEF